MYLSDIRAAIGANQRPVAMLMNDAYAGHRKWWDAEWKEDPSLASVWTEWDYILLRVYQYMEDYRGSGGHPIWVEEDHEVEWEIDRRTSYYEKELESYRNNNDVKAWETPVAKPRWDDSVEPPSMEKWIKGLEEEAEGRSENSPVQMGRPPTPEELAALNAPRGLSE